MSKILAGYILEVAAAYDAAYDTDASNKAVEAARIRVREHEKLHEVTRPKIAAVSSDELVGSIIFVNGKRTKVSTCTSNCAFITESGFEGLLKNVRRRGRSYVNMDERYLQETVDQHVDELIDYAQFQTKTIYQCAEEIVPYLYLQPVYLLLQTAWNDALQWANDVMALRDADGNDTHDFRLVLPGAAADGSNIDFQLSAQDELSAAFKLGQLFHENLNIETVRIHKPT